MPLKMRAKYKERNTIRRTNKEEKRKCKKKTHENEKRIWFRLLRSSLACNQVQQHTTLVSNAGLDFN